MSMNAGQRERNHLFDIIKAVCAITVVVTHLPWGKEIRRNFVFYGLVDMAVPLFILISVFLRREKIKRCGFRGYLSWASSRRALFGLLNPYVVTAIAEMAAAVIIHAIRPSIQYNFLKSFGLWLKWLFTGLSGPGGYYVPIMVQMIVYFPLISLLFRKSRNWGLLLSALINFAYELAVYLLGMPAEIHRLLILRYTLLIGLGIYLADSTMDGSQDKIAVVFFAVGLVSVVVNGSFRQPALFGEWKTTSMVCAAYAYGILYALMRLCSRAQCPFLERIGRASYYVYLVQMVFFRFGGDAILERLFPVEVCAFFRVMQMLAAAVFCCTVGLLFRRMDSALREKVGVDQYIISNRAV